MAKATPKLKSVKAPKKEKKASTAKDFFKTRKTREAEPVAGDVIDAPEEIAEAIDAFREAQDQAKYFEGEATVQKNAINDYSLKEYAKRVFKGKGKSFKLKGNENLVTYIVMDASAGLSEDDVDAFREQWGDEAADDLITRDFASIRFDGEVLEANYDAVVEALKTLPRDVQENLFKTMLMKAKPGAVERAKKYAKTPEELRELIQQLKIRNYIR